jgi:hypothetical protein
MTDERLPDNVMLDDFERLLQLGESEDAPVIPFMMETFQFMQMHGRRVLILARVCEYAMAATNGKAPPS